MNRLIRNDVIIDTIVANLAPAPLAAPSSLATLTLVTLLGHTVNSFCTVLLKSRRIITQFGCLPSAC